MNFNDGSHNEGRFTLLQEITMSKEYAKKFYTSSAWQTCRLSYIAKRIAADGGLCEYCKKELGYIVHHKNKITKENISNPNVTLNHDNLQYVCKKCHAEIHENEYRKRREMSCYFDEKGHPVPKKYNYAPPISKNG